MDYIRLSLAGRNVVTQNPPTDTSSGDTPGAATPGGATTAGDTPARVCSVSTLSEGAGPSSATDYTPTTKPQRKIKDKHRKRRPSNFWGRKVPTRPLVVPPVTPATTAGDKTGSSLGSGLKSTPYGSQQPASESYSADSISPEHVHPSTPNTVATLAYSYTENPFVAINDASAPLALNTFGLPVNQPLSQHIALQDVSKIVNVEHMINDGLNELRAIASNIDINGECETNVDDEFSRMAKSRSNTPDRDSKQ